MTKKYNMHSVIVCDDVRMEASGKAILIGVYDEAIIFANLPGGMPKLIVRLSLTLLEDAKMFSFAVIGLDVKAEHMNQPIPFTAKGSRGNLVFELVPFAVSREQECKVYFGIDGGRDLVLKFDVRLARSEEERAVMARVAPAPP